MKQCTNFPPLWLYSTIQRTCIGVQNKITSQNMSNTILHLSVIDLWKLSVPDAYCRSFDWKSQSICFIIGFIPANLRKKWFPSAWCNDKNRSEQECRTLFYTCQENYKDVMRKCLDKEAIKIKQEIVLKSSLMSRCKEVLFVNVIRQLRDWW